MTDMIYDVLCQQSQNDAIASMRFACYNSHGHTNDWVCIAAILAAVNQNAPADVVRDCYEAIRSDLDDKVAAKMIGIINALQANQAKDCKDGKE